MPRPLRFDGNYQEEVVLRDGTHVFLRLLCADDKELLARGFEQLSEESRYRRFFGSKPRLSERDLRYLTEIDGSNHFAIGVVYRDPMEREEGLGIGRFVRCSDGESVAEPAVAVIDSFQHQGLGRLLCRRLAEAAAERGIAYFRCEVLARNDPMRAILQDLAPSATVTWHGDTATIEFPLGAFAPKTTTQTATETTEATPSSMLDYLLGLAGRGYIILRRSLPF